MWIELIRSFRWEPVLLKLNTQAVPVVDGSLQVSAKAVIFDGEKVLLLKSSDGTWDLPGGKIDSDEDVLDGLRREVLEETNLKVNPEQLLGTRLRSKRKRDDSMLVTYLCSLAEKPGADSVSLSDEHKSYKFVRAKRALKLPLPDRFREAIKLAANLS